jgi:hypothetical protein
MTSNTFHADLVKALGELPNLEKTGFNPHFKASFVPLESVLTAIRPVLARNNFAVIQDGYMDDLQKLVMKTTLIHSSGEMLHSTIMKFPIVDPKPQQLGSLLSYARRYQLMTFLCLAGDSDLDEKGTSDSNVSKAIASAQALKNKKSPTINPQETEDDDII